MISRIANAVVARAPHWLLDMIEWMLARDSAAVRWIKGRAAAGIPVPPSPQPDAASPVRVFFGPFNYAGQAHQWARMLTEANAGISAQNLTVIAHNDLGFATDASVPAAVFAGSHAWRQQQQRAFGSYTHVVIESLTSMLGAGRRQGLAREIAWHLADGRKVALLCHGTDIRSPRAHAERSAFSPFDMTDKATQRLQRRTEQNREVMDAFDLPVFYSTPDLAHDVPEGEWLPLVIDPQQWSEAAERHGIRPQDRAIPIVQHAPTAATIKGTADVERAVRQLAGVVEYRPLSGIPSSQMPGHVATADIVVDQLLLGSYGATAVEAMAAGRVVVAHVDDEVRDVILDRTGFELPIVEADPNTLADVLRRLAFDPAERGHWAELGPHFVREVHAGAQTLKVMAEFLGVSSER